MSKLKPVFQQYNVFLYLLPVFFILHGFTVNHPLIPVADATKLLAKYLLATLIMLLFFYLFFKSWQKASLFAFLLMCTQFFFGAIQDVLKSLVPQSFISRYSFLLSVIFIGLIFAFFLIKKTNSSLKKIRQYLSITLVCLIIVDTGILIFKLADVSNTKRQIANIIKCPNCKKPNIYLIIVDEYAGRRELHDIFAFDNSFFENELKKRNFFTVAKPTSNYNYTPYSMASIFSMTYIKGITTKSNDVKNRKVSYETINKNELVNILKEFGYDFINLSLFDFADKAGIDNNEFYSTREKIINSQTLTGRLQKDLWYHLITTFKSDWAKQAWQKRLINVLQKEYKETIIASEKASLQPRFVYTHFIMPHYPYLFDKNGAMLSFEESMQGGRKDLYLEYLQYCNKQSIGLVDSILLKDKTKPIIIVMSDHGFTKYDPSVINPKYNFDNMINIYFPDKNYSSIPDSISNINLFRIILNKQFKQQLPLLKDSTIFLKEY